MTFVVVPFAIARNICMPSNPSCVFWNAANLIGAFFGYVQIAAKSDAECNKYGTSLTSKSSFIFEMSIRCFFRRYRRSHSCRRVHMKNVKRR